MPSHERALPTVAEFLAAVDVFSVPLQPDKAEAPIASVSVPSGWRQIAVELMPNAYGVWAIPPEAGTKWAEAGWADNAVLLVGRLSGEVDTGAVMRCAFTDSRRMPEWYELGSDADDYDGWPSAQITGAYTVAGLTFWSCTRYLLTKFETGPHLVQLTVTTRVDASRDGAAIAGSLSIQSPTGEAEPLIPPAPAPAPHTPDAETDGDSDGIAFHI